jgi:hypothetical protein
MTPQQENKIVAFMTLISILVIFTALTIIAIN